MQFWHGHGHGHGPRSVTLLLLLLHSQRHGGDAGRSLLVILWWQTGVSGDIDGRASRAVIAGLLFVNGGHCVLVLFICLSACLSVYLFGFSASYALVKKRL